MGVPSLAAQLSSTFAMFQDGLFEAPEVSALLPLLDIGKIVVFSFLLKFQVVLVSIFPEVAGLDGKQNGTAGLLGVGAVGEAAGVGKVVNI